MRPQRISPRSQPVARYVAMLLSILLLGVIFVIARELWTLRTGSHLESWLDPIFDTIGRARYQPWMFPAGLASAALGVILLLVAIWPRAHTHRVIESTSNVWMRPVDIARMCTAAAEKIPGVMRASSLATARTVTVSLSGDVKDASLVPRVETALRPLLEILADSPVLVVKVQQRNENAA